MLGSNVQLERIAHLHQKPVQELHTLPSSFMMLLMSSIVPCILLYSPSFEYCLRHLKSPIPLFPLSSNLLICNCCLLCCAAEAFPV